MALLTDRVHSNMSHWEGAQKKKKLSEPWCECNVNGKGKLMRAYSTEVMSEVMQSTRVVKRRILRQHELVKREKHSMRSVREDRPYVLRARRRMKWKKTK